MLPDLEQMAKAHIATWNTMDTAPTVCGTRVLLFDGAQRIGTRMQEGYWEADEGGLIEPSRWMALPHNPEID